MPVPKLTLYIAMSLDGFIAPHDDDLSWLSIVEKEGEDYGYAAFTSTIGAYILGRATYDVVLKLTGGTFPQAERFDCYVISRQERPDENGVTFYNGPIEELVARLKKEGKNIYCDGGGQIVQLLMQKKNPLPLLLKEII